MDILKHLSTKVVDGNINEVKELVQKAIERKVDVQEIMNEGFIGGLDVVSAKYTAGEFFLPEMLVSAMAVTAGLELLKSLVNKYGIKPEGTVVAGTVEGDLHDIGKRMVCMMCEGHGFTVIDLGTDVPAEEFIKAAMANQADIIAMSALLSTTRANMEDIIRKIRDSGLCQQIKIMVGGACITQDFADGIGADGYAPNAVLAVKKAKELMRVSSC